MAKYTHEEIVNVLKKISVNAIITKNMLDMGRVIQADRKNDAVIDQLALLTTRLSEAMAEEQAATAGTQG